MREFVLSDKGIDLVDVYTGPGAVYTGAARLSQEAHDKAETLVQHQAERAAPARAGRRRAATCRRKSPPCRPGSPISPPSSASPPHSRSSAPTPPGAPRRNWPAPERRIERNTHDQDQITTPAERWQLRLYVAGQTPKSIAALANLKKLCETHLAGRYEIEVIDLLKNPKLAAGDQILAIPTLVRKLPEPVKKIIGDLSNEHRVLVGLDLRPLRRNRHSTP